MSNKWEQLPLELPFKPTVWVLTSEVDAHDQFGEYFEEMFTSKPTIHQLIDAGVREDHIKVLLDTGSSFECSSIYWWVLKELTPK